MRLILFISLLEELCLLSGKGNSQVFHSIFNSVNPGFMNGNLSTLAEQKHFSASFPENPVKQLRIRKLPAQTELTGCKQRLHLAV